MCKGAQQSPMNIDTTETFKTVGTAGKLLSASSYVSQNGLVRISTYMRTAMIEGNFGTLILTSNGHTVEYEAVQVHLTSSSLHTVNGEHYDGEVMVVHRPKGAKDLLEGGVIVSAFFKEDESEASVLFSQMGFSTKAGDVPSEKSNEWLAPDAVSLSEIAPALSGDAFFYNGSLPVPPCTENIKWFVAATPLPVMKAQTDSLHEMLRTLAGDSGSSWKTDNKRYPIPRNGRAMTMNTLELGKDHSAASCAGFSKEERLRSARCWGEITPRCPHAPESPILIGAAEAVGSAASGDAPSFNYKVPSPSHSLVTVQPSMYTLDATPNAEEGFGHLEIHGRIFPVMKISVKAVGAHVYDGKRYAAELNIEHTVFGDTLRDTEKFPTFNPAPYTIIVSIPIKLGLESPLLRQMGLGATAFQMTIADGHSYHPVEDVDLMDNLATSLAGKWFWYNGTGTSPDCDGSVKWMIVSTPIEANLEQLNFLALSVPGMDATPLPVAQSSDAILFADHLPSHAVQYTRECPDPATPFNYMNTHCWDQCETGCSAVCHEGLAQSPVNVETSQVAKAGTDHLLSMLRWKPISKLHVVNNGHSIVVANQQMGYIQQIGTDGFAAFYTVVQFHVHMPSEHLLNGKQHHAELHIEHAKQVTVDELDFHDLITVAVFLDIGDMENPLLQQLLLPNEAAGAPPDQQEFEVADDPIDLMRALGPVVDGNFYSYKGSLTTPPCSEMVKWLIFETSQSMSFDQWIHFKMAFANPANNRPVQPMNGRKLSMNSFALPTEDLKLNSFRFNLYRNRARDRRDGGGVGWIVVPILATIMLCLVVMTASFVREDRKRAAEAAGGLEEVIGKGTYAPVGGP